MIPEEERRAVTSRVGTEGGEKLCEYHQVDEVSQLSFSVVTEKKQNSWYSPNMNDNKKRKKSKKFSKVPTTYSIFPKGKL